MQNKHTVSLTFTEDEWDYINGEAHFHNVTVEKFLEQYVRRELLLNMEFANLLSSEHVKYIQFTENLHYYLTTALNEAKQLEDNKMENVLTSLRDNDIYYRVVIDKLFRDYLSD